jgi:prepilin-type N-terminal cleavage/methylation domain-containing protein
MGFTLMEIIVATSIFAVFVVIIANIFQSVVEDQRRTIAMQNIQENLRYVLEVMSKEIRQAQRSDAGCTVFFNELIADNRIFNFNDTDGAQRIYFKNKAGRCVSYYQRNGVLYHNVEGAETAATPDELTVSGLVFKVRDNVIGILPVDRIQPLVTWKFQIKFNTLGSRYEQPITIQTSVSSRIYE